MRKRNSHSDSVVASGDREVGQGNIIQWPDSNQYITALNELFVGGTGGPQRSLIDHLRALSKRIWTVALVFILGILASVLYLQNTTPYYVSRATIEVEKAMPTTAGMNELFAFFGHFDLYYQTQLESLKSRDVAREYFRRLDAKQQKESGVGRTAAEGPVSEPAASEATAVSGGTEEAERKLAEERRMAARINSIVSSISVAPVKGTQLITVDLGVNDPVVARDTLQGYLETFIDYNRRTRNQIRAKVKAWLDRELSEIKGELKKSEGELLAFTEKHGVVFLDKNPNQMATFFDRATKSLLDSKSKRVSIEAMSQAKEAALSTPVSNEAVNNLKHQLAQLKSQYSSMQSIYSPEYHKIIMLQQKIKSTEDTISELEKDTLSSALATAKTEEVASKDDFEKTKEEAIKSFPVSVQYDILRKAVDANAQLYLMLLQRSKQAELDHGVMGHNILINSAPSLPLAPLYPRKDKILIVGAILGLFGGILLAVTLELADDSARTPETIQKALCLPILGAIPRMDRDRSWLRMKLDGTGCEFVVHKFPSSPFADAVRIVQNTATAYLPSDSGCVMAVSSALPMEGKTLISVLLGSVMASENKKILIMDGDLRRPRIHEILGRRSSGRTGLSDFLRSNSSTWDSAIQASQIPGLYYMPAGSIPDNPVSLLKSRRMSDLVETCRKTFDIIILDTPPILGVVDTRIVAGYADGLVLVTRVGDTPVELLLQAKEALAHSDSRVLGVVLNMADPKRHGYGYHGYYYPNYYYKKGKA